MSRHRGTPRVDRAAALQRGPSPGRRPWKPSAGGESPVETRTNASDNQPAPPEPILSRIDLHERIVQQWITDGFVRQDFYGCPIDIDGVQALQQHQFGQQRTCDQVGKVVGRNGSFLIAKRQER